MQTVQTAAGECTIAELAADWIGQMSEGDREQIRRRGAAGWRSGIAQSEPGLTTEQVDLLVSVIEHQVRDVALSLPIPDRERADGGVGYPMEYWRDVQVSPTGEVWARDPVSRTYTRSHDLTEAEIAEARRLAGLVRAGTHWVSGGHVMPRR